MGDTIYTHGAPYTKQFVRHFIAADAASDMEVQALFDDIEYQKGGSVLRMLWNYMSSAHYAGSKLPKNVLLGHDVHVCPSGRDMSALCHTCSATAMPAHAVLPMCSLRMQLLMRGEATLCILQAQEACACRSLHTMQGCTCTANRPASQM